MKQQDGGNGSWNSDGHFKRGVQFDEVVRFEFRPGVIGLPTSARNHVDIELEVDDVVFAVQEGADDLFLRSLPFQLGIDLVVRRWGQRINLVKAFLVGCQRPHDIRFHVPYVDARADNHFAAGILNGAMNVLRLGPGILPPAGEQLRPER